MDIEITDEQINQVKEEWKVIRQWASRTSARQAEYSRYYTFHHLLEMLGLLSLIEGE